MFAAYSEFKPSKKKMPVVVLGLCKGAIHDTGKNVIKICLEANGFKVIDVGKCAEPLSFALAAAKNKAKVVGISIPVTTSIPFIKKTIRLIRKRSPKSKIVIGGCAINEEWVSLVGVDGYAPNAESAVKLFKRLCA